MPTDSEMLEELYSRDFYNLSQSMNYLIAIEKYNNPAFSLQDPTIEHILPETMHTSETLKKSKISTSEHNKLNWEIDLGPNAITIHDKYQHTLGNLTILPRAENSRMGNYRFKIKKDWNNKADDGFCFGYSHTPIRISQSLSKNNEWGEKQIKERCKQMVKWICEIWPRP